MSNYIFKSKKNTPYSFMEGCIILVLPIFAAIFFGVELADISQYAEDHNIGSNPFALTISISFLIVYWAIHKIESAFLEWRHIDECSITNSWIWLFWQIFIGLIALTVYWYLILDLVLWLLNISLSAGAEKNVFDWDLKMWIASIYFNSFLFNHKDFAEHFLGLLPQRVLVSLGRNANGE